MVFLASCGKCEAGGLLGGVAQRRCFLQAMYIGVPWGLGGRKSLRPLRLRLPLSGGPVNGGYPPFEGRKFLLFDRLFSRAPRAATAATQLSGFSVDNRPKGEASPSRRKDTSPLPLGVNRVDIKTIIGIMSPKTEKNTMTQTRATFCNDVP